MIERSPEGWHIQFGSRFYNVTEDWLRDMWTHQVKPRGSNPDFNLLWAAWQRDADPDEFLRLFIAFMRSRSKVNNRKVVPVSDFQEFVRRQRENGR